MLHVLRYFFFLFTLVVYPSTVLLVVPCVPLLNLVSCFAPLTPTGTETDEFVEETILTAKFAQCSTFHTSDKSTKKKKKKPKQTEGYELETNRARRHQKGKERAEMREREAREPRVLTDGEILATEGRRGRTKSTIIFFGARCEERPRMSPDRTRDRGRNE